MKFTFLCSKLFTSLFRSNTLFLLEMSCTLITLCVKSERWKKCMNVIARRDSLTFLAAAFSTPWLLGVMQTTNGRLVSLYFVLEMLAKHARLALNRCRYQPRLTNVNLHRGREYFSSFRIRARVRRYTYKTVASTSVRE